MQVRRYSTTAAFMPWNWRSDRSTGSAGSLKIFSRPWRETSTVQVTPSSLISMRETENFSSWAQPADPQARSSSTVPADFMVLGTLEEENDRHDGSREKQIGEEIAPDDRELVAVLESPQAVGQ